MGKSHYFWTKRPVFSLSLTSWIPGNVQCLSPPLPGLELCLPTSVRKRSLPTSSGGLNLARKTCRCRLLLRFRLSANPLVVPEPRPLRDQTVQPETEESWKKKRIFDFLSFKGASPSQRGHLKPHWCLTLLSAASSTVSFTCGVLISVARSAPKSQRNDCVSQNPA